MDNAKLETIQKKLWPHIFDLETARKAAMQGVWISIFIMVLNTIVILINNSYWNFVDVVIVGILAFGIFKMSRIAAVLALIFYLIGQIHYVIEHGKSNYIMIAIITVAYISSIRGVFAHHTIKRMARNIQPAST